MAKATIHNGYNERTFIPSRSTGVLPSLLEKYGLGRNYYVAHAFVVCKDYYRVCDVFEILYDNNI